jgi:acyl carrier protein
MINQISLKMENKQIRRNLYRALRKTGVRKEHISPEADFKEDLHFDTTDWKIFTYFLENIFKVNIEEDSIKNLHSVNDTITLLRQTA